MGSMRLKSYTTIGPFICGDRYHLLCWKPGDYCAFGCTTLVRYWSVLGCPCAFNSCRLFSSQLPYLSWLYGLSVGREEKATDTCGGSSSPRRTKGSGIEIQPACFLSSEFIRLGRTESTPHILSANSDKNGGSAGNSPMCKAALG